MQAASPRIGTRVTVSISYNDNHYTTSAFKIMLILRSYLQFFVLFLKKVFLHTVLSNMNNSESNLFD